MDRTKPFGFSRFAGELASAMHYGSFPAHIRGNRRAADAGCANVPSKEGLTQRLQVLEEGVPHVF